MLFATGWLLDGFTSCRPPGFWLYPEPRRDYVKKMKVSFFPLLLLALVWAGSPVCPVLAQPGRPISIGGDEVVFEVRGPVGRVGGQARVGQIVGKVSVIDGRSEVAIVEGNVSSIGGDSRVGYVIGKVSHIGDRSQVGRIIGSVSDIRSYAQVDVVDGSVSWVNNHSRVGLARGKVSWVIDSGRVGIVRGDLSWAIDDARVGLVKGKVSHVKNNARVGVIIGDVSWVADDGYVGLVVGKTPQIKDQGRVGAVVNRETCRTQYHWLCSWLGYTPSLDRQMAALDEERAPAALKKPVAAPPEKRAVGAGSLENLLAVLPEKRSAAVAPCARFVTLRSRFWVRAEAPVDCGEIRRQVKPGFQEAPDLKELLTALLIPPLNSHERDGLTVNTYGRAAPLTVYFQSGYPKMLRFNAALPALASPGAVVSRLGFAALSSPFEFHKLDSVIWFDRGNRFILQVKGPEFRLDGQYIYSVLVYFPGEEAVVRFKKWCGAMSRLATRRGR